MCPQRRSGRTHDPRGAGCQRDDRPSSCYAKKCVESKDAQCGSVTAGLAIYDTMQFIAPEISTICLGQAASMGAVLMTAGTKGKRFGLQYSRFLLHQIMGGVQGQATDIEIQANEILRIGDMIDDILVNHTGQTKDRIKADSDRDFFMGAKEALEYGMIDEVLLREPK